MRRLSIGAAILAAILSLPVSAQTARYSTKETPIKALLADPAAKAIIAKHFPEFIASSAVARGQADRFTIRSIRRFKPRLFNDQRLAAADAELAKLPPR